MKKLLCFLFLLIILFFVYVKRDYIINFVMKNYIDNEYIVFGEPNSYYRDYNYAYVQNTTDLTPENKQDILNIIYTTLNRGLNEITFYCGNDYPSCINDVNDIAEDNMYLSTINNLVHPFNSYSNIYFTITSYGKIHVNVSRIYSNSDIEFVNKKIDEISSSIIDDDMSVYDKIKTFHDYIIDHTVYDSSISIENQLSSGTNSNNAFGLLLNGKAICSGYSDVMAIFLNRYGINNYKISSDEHIWNLVYYNNEWKHIDVTWDDPVTSDGTDVLLHDFFLIDSDVLFEKESSFDKNEHQFNSEFYAEAN